MSSPRTRIITLNLGSQSIELAEFRAQPPGGLTLCGYRSRELLADSTREATRSTQVVAVLREMMGGTAIRAARSLHGRGESVFTRFVKLPRRRIVESLRLNVLPPDTHHHA